LRRAEGDQAKADRGPVAPPRAIDDLDREIVEALQEDGRESFRRIATRVGVTETTVRARYGRLTSANVLQVTGVTNPLALGFDGQAMVGIRVSGPPEPVAEEIAGWNEASYVVITAGRFDVLAELVCSREHFRDVTNRIRSLPDVLSTESFLYLELVKQLYNWGARPATNGPKGRP
jgi:Lrp/AsnC family transcriptional regulator, regulator for asnA, asnC and gidA